MLTFSAESHLDHGLSPAHVVWLLHRFSDRDAFFIETAELPADYAPLRCALHGPLVGGDPVPESEVFYQVRGDRPGRSRGIARESQETRLVTVIAGPTDDGSCVIYTAYGGPAAPREPFDPALEGDALAESEAFWEDHALAIDAFG